MSKVEVLLHDLTKLIKFVLGTHHVLKEQESTNGLRAGFANGFSILLLRKWGQYSTYGGWLRNGLQCLVLRGHYSLGQWTILNLPKFAENIIVRSESNMTGSHVVCIRYITLPPTAPARNQPKWAVREYLVFRTAGQ